MPIGQSKTICGNVSCATLWPTLLTMQVAPPDDWIWWPNLQLIELSFKVQWIPQFLNTWQTQPVQWGGSTWACLVKIPTPLTKWKIWSKIETVLHRGGGGSSCNGGCQCQEWRNLSRQSSIVFPAAIFKYNNLAHVVQNEPQRCGCSKLPLPLRFNISVLWKHP